VLGKAETIKNELAYSRVQFAKVLALWENAARSSMGGKLHQHSVSSCVCFNVLQTTSSILRLSIRVVLSRLLAWLSNDHWFTSDARLEELALQSPNGTIDTDSLRQIRLDEQVKEPVMSILTGDLLHMLLVSTE
jgi:hypothetical protein